MDEPHRILTEELDRRGADPSTEDVDALLGGHRPPQPGPDWVVGQDNLGWSADPAVVADVATRQKCRYMASAGRPHAGPIVAVLYRGTNRRPYAYCAEHLYGRWIEDGVVLMWKYRPPDATP